MKLLPLALLITSPVAAMGSPPTVPGIQFADSPSTLYVPVHPIAAYCALQVSAEGRKLEVNKTEMTDVRELYDGTKLIPLHALAAFGGKTAWDATLQTATLSVAGKTVLVKLGSKRVEVNKTAQELRAYQGDVLVLDTRVSTGRKGHRTPSGDFAAHGKERIHYSQLYDDSPMPWAVQIDGNVFIHGYTSVPRFPASHGCIRMPLRGKNAARYFYSWVSIGTPVTVGDSWSASPAIPAPAVKEAKLTAGKG